MEETLDWLTQAAQGSNSPFVMVILLAIVFSLDPCAMMTNIAAIGYISKDIEDKRIGLRKGLWYTVGRTASYGILGTMLIMMLRAGKNVDIVDQTIDRWGQPLLIAALGAMGIMLCIADRLHGFKINISVERFGLRAQQDNIGAMLLGALLSLAFCPTNAILFFGMMVPTAASSIWWITLPFLFAAVSAIPVVIIAYILIYSMSSIARYYDNIRRLSSWLRWIVGMLFVAAAIWLMISSLSPHEHEHHHHSHCEHAKL